jgi:hypothetical protein
VTACLRDGLDGRRAIRVDFLARAPNMGEDWYGRKVRIEEVR